MVRGSVCIIVGGLGYSVPISNTKIPLPEQNRLGSTDASCTGAWWDATHHPPTSLRATGPRARSVARCSHGSTPSSPAKKPSVSTASVSGSCVMVRRR